MSTVPTTERDVTAAETFLRSDTCHEEVFSRDGDGGPCGAHAVAIRIDPNWDSPYPVCARHARAPLVTISGIVRGIMATGVTTL